MQGFVPSLTHIASLENTMKEDVKGTLRVELASSRIAFHVLLDSLSDGDLQKHSTNAAWTNKHIVVHMAMGFFILPSLILLALLFGRLPKPISKLFALLLIALTIPFNWINALGPYIGAVLLTRASLKHTFDWFYARIVRLLQLRDPASFKDYMTLADIFRMPIRHFAFHLKQLSR